MIKFSIPTDLCYTHVARFPHSEPAGFPMVLWASQATIKFGGKGLKAATGEGPYPLVFPNSLHQKNEAIFLRVMTVDTKENLKPSCF